MLKKLKLNEKKENNELLSRLRPFLMANTLNGQYPKGYNEKIHWLMVNDQMAEQVICSDKLLCRSFVANRVGEKYLRKLYQTSKHLKDIRFDRLPETFVIKTNHDSGSVYIVNNKITWREAKRKLQKRMKRTYGLHKGEWAYSYILPRVFAEEFMPGPITDYKFHCCDGQICWVQVIYDRISGHPREVNIDEKFSSLGVHFDDNFIPESEAPEMPYSWNEMKELARRLSEGFRYVRVDLYEFRARPSFGELTFWPRAGNYMSEGEQKLGELIEFDTAFRRPMIHDFFAKASL